MRPPASQLPSKNRYPNLIVITGLFSGILITGLIWLKLPNQFITSLSLISLSLIGLGSLLYIRKRLASQPRWVTILAAIAAVSLVYLFPEMFGPTCGGMPRAFASPSARCGRCVDFVCEWNEKKHQEHCYCAEWDDSGCTETQTQPPSIEANLTCSSLGQNGWCAGSYLLELSAVEPQGLNVMISGDINGTPFACAASPAASSCSVPFPEGNGTATFTATSDSALTASGSATYQRDSVQPQIDGWLNGTAGSNGWFISAVDVNASASDPLPGSGLAAFVYKLNNKGDWITYTGPLHISNGAHSLSLRASDVVGHIIDTVQTIRVDTIMPALNLSVTGTAGANGWYRSVVQVNATASDSVSGLSAIQYDLNGAGWTAYTAPLGLSDGVHSLSMYALDKAGNSTSWSQSFQVDTTTPVLDLTVDGTLGTNGWYTSFVQINVMASDPGSPLSGASGLNALEYNLDGAGWATYSAPLGLSDGIHNLELRAIDGAGNVTNWSQSFQVDTITPLLNLTASGALGTDNWYTSPIQINVTASDPGSPSSGSSGLGALEYNLDGTGWGTYSAPLDLSDGLHNLELRAIDGAGNSTSWSQSFQVDTITPVLNLTVDGTLETSGWYTSLVKIDMSASDPGSPISGASGLNALEYNLDNAGWIAYSAPLELSDGLHNLELRATDMAGNVTSGTQGFRVDAVPPTLDVNLSGTQGASPWYVSIVQVEAVADDTTSELSTLEMQVDGGDWSMYNAPLVFGDGLHAYRFRARDNAGNLTEIPLQRLQVDTIPPAISLPESWEFGEIAHFELLDNGSGLASVWLAIEDELERYPRVTWENTLASYNFDGEINWDGRFNDGTLAPPGGAYNASLKVKDNAGNETQETGQIKIPLLSFVDTPIDPPGDLVSGAEGSDPIATLIPNSDTNLNPIPDATLDTNSDGNLDTDSDANLGTASDTNLDADEETISQPSGENTLATLSFGGGSNNSGASGEQTALNLGGVSNSFGAPGEQAALNPGSGSNSAEASGGQSTLSLGGGSNNTEASGEQSALSLGGGNNGAAQPSNAQTGMVSFNAGGQSNSPASNASSNLLWGATATAAIGAFAAEIARRKQEEEAKEHQRIARLEKRQENREDNNYRQKVQDQKKAELEVKWALEREKAQAEAEQNRQAATNRRFAQKEAQAEAETRGFGDKPQELGASYYQYMAQKAYENFRAQEMETPASTPPAASTLEKSQEQKPWWENTWNAITHPVESFENMMINWGNSSNTGRKAIKFFTDAATELNNPVRNPVANAFGQAIRDGWAGLTYGIASTVNLASETISSIKKGNWENTKRYGGDWLKGVVQGWMWGSVQTIGQLAWGAIKMATPIGLFETVPTWLDTMKEAWHGKRGFWDVSLTSLMLMGNLLGIYGTYNAISSTRTAQTSNTQVAAVEEANPALISDARLAWEGKLSEAELASRLPNDTLALESARLLAKDSSTGKVELVKISQDMKDMLIRGEKPPNLEEVLDPQAFQLIDEIARNQLFGEGDRFVLGAHTGRESGYIGTARYEGGVYFETNPAVYETLKVAFGDQVSDVSWLVNQRVMELTTFEKLPEFLNKGLSRSELNFELETVNDIWNNPSMGPSNARYLEIRWLRSQGFQIEPIFDEVNNLAGYRFLSTEVKP